MGGVGQQLGEDGQSPTEFFPGGGGHQSQPHGGGWDLTPGGEVAGG